MKPHVFAAMVNEVRALARQYGQMEQFRCRVADLLGTYIRVEHNSKGVPEQSEIGTHAVVVPPLPKPTGRRAAPRATKAIATRVTIIAECEDGIRVTQTASNPSGLTTKQMEFEAESFARQMSRLSQGAPMHGSSPAKYIMLEIQREGEP